MAADKREKGKADGETSQQDRGQPEQRCSGAKHLEGRGRERLLHRRSVVRSGNIKDRVASEKPLHRWKRVLHLINLDDGLCRRVRKPPGKRQQNKDKKAEPQTARGPLHRCDNARPCAHRLHGYPDAVRILRFTA